MSLFISGSFPCSEVYFDINVATPAFLFFFLFNCFIYFWLCWVFVAAHGLSLVVAAGATLRCSAQASHHGGFSCGRAWAPGT